MDGRRFDSWTKRLAVGLPRRDTIKVLAGAAIAGVTTRAASEEAEACFEDGQFCTTNDECCGTCIAFNCADCVPKGGHGCEGDNDCCGGKQECKNGVCKVRSKKKDLSCDGRNCKKKKKKKKNNSGGTGCRTATGENC